MTPLALSMWLIIAAGIGAWIALLAVLVFLIHSSAKARERQVRRQRQELFQQASPDASDARDPWMP